MTKWLGVCLRWKALLLLVCLLYINSLMAQTEKKLVREGNKQYNGGKFNDSEISYRKALDKNKKSFEGAFNLGDALYKQGKYEEALEQYKSIASQQTSKENQSKLHHNIANTLLQTKKYEESIEEYKNSLKLNPKDNDTKYNLEYAKSMLKKEQQQKKDDQKKDKDKKDEKKDDKKDQDKKDQENKDKKDDKKEENKDQGDKGDKDDQQKNQPKDKSKISKEDAQRMLDALNNKERQTQKKLGKKEAVRGVNIEKDW